jgi:hypothetical protein
MIKLKYVMGYNDECVHVGINSKKEKSGRGKY